MGCSFFLKKKKVKKGKNILAGARNSLIVFET